MLLEHGNKSWDQSHSVADYIFSEMVDESLVDNSGILQLMNAFRDQMLEDASQANKNHFIYHPDPKLSALAVSLLNFPYEESGHWRKEYSQATGDRKQLFEQGYEQFIQTVARDNDQQLMNFLKMDEDRTHLEIDSALNYLKLRKI